MHRIRTSIAITAVMASLAPAVAAAQAPAPLDRADLRRYVAEVLERNDAFGAALSDLDAATERIGPAGALPDPVIELGMRSVPVPSFDFDREAMTQLPIGFRQDLPFPGKQAARTDVARRDSALAAAGTQGLEATLVVRAASAYFGLVYARNAIDLWDARIRLAGQAVAAARTRYETGAVPQADLLRAELRRADLVERTFDLDAVADEARADMDALRGGTDGPIAPLDLTDPTGPQVLATMSDTVADLQTLGGRLESGNPELRLATARVDRARSEARVFAIAARPDFYVAIQNGIRFGGRQPFLSATAGVALPIWSGRKQAPAARAADLSLEAEQHRYDDLRAALTGDLRSGVARLRALRSRVEQLRNEVLPLADAASESALSAYAAGSADLSAVLDAQDDFFEARLRLARVLTDYAAERAALSALLGEEWYR